MAETAFPIVYTSDLRQLVGFYRDQFGFEETYHWPETGERQFIAMKCGDSAVGFSTREAAARTMDVALEPSTTISFELCIYVNDVDATSEELRSRGVPEISRPTDRPWGERSAYFEDPDGNPFQIVAPIG